MPTVYVVNKSSHDISAASKWGEFTYLSDKAMNRFNTNNMHRQFSEILKDSKADDLILVSGLTNMNIIACSIFALRHQRLNLLIYKAGNYIERNLIL